MDGNEWAKDWSEEEGEEAKAAECDGGVCRECGAHTPKASAIRGSRWSPRRLKVNLLPLQLSSLTIRHGFTISILEADHRHWLCLKAFRSLGISSNRSSDTSVECLSWWQLISWWLHPRRCGFYGLQVDKVVCDQGRWIPCQQLEEMRAAAKSRCSTAASASWKDSSSPHRLGVLLQVIINWTWSTQVFARPALVFRGLYSWLRNSFPVDGGELLPPTSSQYVMISLARD